MRVVDIEKNVDDDRFFLHMFSRNRMPFKYHPYFNFYRQHMKEAEGEEANEGGANNASPLHSYHPYFYRPYYNYNPYFYYGPPQQPAMIEV